MRFYQTPFLIGQIALVTCRLARIVLLGDLGPLPLLSHYTVRNSAQLAYRAYPGGREQVAVLIHGTATESSVMNGLAKTLQTAGAAVYALDLRGHGGSGRRGVTTGIDEIKKNDSANIEIKFYSSNEYWHRPHCGE
jgi:pimeloyl-ACP methyl ester carboxylesterase